MAITFDIERRAELLAEYREEERKKREAETLALAQRACVKCRFFIPAVEFAGEPAKCMNLHVLVLSMEWLATDRTVSTLDARTREDMCGKAGVHFEGKMDVAAQAETASGLASITASRSF